MASIRRRGEKSWQVRVTVRDPATGEFTEKAVTVRGTKRDAERVAAEMEAQKAKGQLALSGAVTVGEYLRRWLSDYAASHVNPRTFRSYRGTVEQHLIPALGNIRLDRLHVSHINRYYSDALRFGNVKTGGALSPTSVLMHHRILREALHHAVEWGLISLNPAVLAKPPRKARAGINPLPPERIPAVLSAVQGTWLFLPVYLALHTGARLSEILALTWEDVDFDACCLYIRQAMVYTADTGFQFRRPKSGKGRAVPVLPEVMKVLKRHRAEQAEWRLAMGPDWPPHNLVLTQRDGSPLKPNTVSSAFHQLSRERGWDIRFHDLRHTHATLLLREGVNPKVVAERLGHSGVAITLDIYSHVLPDIQQEAVSKLARVLPSGQILDK